MKGTEQFKKTIQSYLEQRASYDELFAHSYRNPEKSIDKCIDYILSEVYKSGCNGHSDEEIYSYSLHYFDEIDLEVGNPIDCRVVVNHVVELTEQEKAQARIDAVERVRAETYARIMQQQNKRATAKKNEVTPQKSLFDL